MQHRGLGLFFKNHFFPEPLNFHCEPQIFCRTSISDRSLTPQPMKPGAHCRLCELCRHGSLGEVLLDQSGPQQRTAVFFCVAQRELKKHTAYWVNKLVFNRDRI
jgi:hypothetical protein